jgi:heptaprenylglyceryl phosphate synthase
VNFINRILDPQVERKASGDRFSELQDATRDAPLVPKYDPEDFDGDGISVEEIEEVVDSPMVGAVQIGGSGDDVTEQNMLDAVRTVQDAYDGILMMEPGKQEDIGDGGLNSEIVVNPDIFNKPGVWNTEDSMWINGHRRKAQTRLNGYLEDNAEEMVYSEVRESLESLPGVTEGMAEALAQDYIEWKDDPESTVKRTLDARMVPEIYYVLNPESTAGEITGASEDLRGKTQEEIETDVRGMVADLVQDGYEGIVYLEGSGGLAPPAIVESASSEIEARGASEDVMLAYGGGVGTDSTIPEYVYDTDIAGMDTEAQLDEYTGRGADIVLVGNSIQENGSDVLE